MSAPEPPARPRRWAPTCAVCDQKGKLEAVNNLCTLCYLVLGEPSTPLAADVLEALIIAHVDTKGWLAFR